MFIKEGDLIKVYQKHNFRRIKGDYILINFNVEKALEKYYYNIFPSYEVYNIDKKEIELLERSRYTIEKHDEEEILQNLDYITIR